MGGGGLCLYNPPPPKYNPPKHTPPQYNPPSITPRKARAWTLSHSRCIPPPPSKYNPPPLQGAGLQLEPLALVCAGLDALQHHPQLRHLRGQKTGAVHTLPLTVAEHRPQLRHLPRPPPPPPPPPLPPLTRLASGLLPKPRDARAFCRPAPTG